MTRPSFDTYTEDVDNLPAGGDVVTRSVTITESQTLTRGAVLGRIDQQYTLAITGTPTGGTFVLDADEAGATAPIAFNASVADVQAALEAVGRIGEGNVKVTGNGALPGNEMTITFIGRWAGVDPVLTADGSALTGGTTPAVTATDASDGAEGQYGAFDGESTTGLQTPVAILAEDVTTDAAETTKAIIYEAGHFNSSALSGVSGDVALAALTNELRALGIHLVTAVPASTT